MVLIRGWRQQAQTLVKLGGEEFLPLAAGERYPQDTNHCNSNDEKAIVAVVFSAPALGGREHKPAAQLARLLILERWYHWRPSYGDTARELGPEIGGRPRWIAGADEGCGIQR